MRLECAGAAVFAFLLAAGCSGSLAGLPDFQQTYGTVDAPCTPSKASVSRCTAHVYLVNHGGEGVALAIVAVPVTEAGAAPSPASGARTNASVKCGGYIPDTPSGAEADLSCQFDLAPGKTVAGTPVLQQIKTFSATGASGSSGGGEIGIATLGLAVIAALIAVVALGLALMKRLGAYTPEAAAGTLRGPSGRRPRQPDQEEDDEDW